MEMAMRSSGGRSVISALVATLVLSALWVLPVSAQDAGFPPWPIVYDGTVELDGEPLESGTLTARVGDWTSTAVPVVDGWFACADLCLILGPPTFDYVGAEVTFHLDGIGRAASLKFEFPGLSEPDRQTTALEFTSDTGLPVWLLGAGGGLALLLGGAVVALMFRRGDDS
jgi:hypothetical protein